jgi:DNA topoisomerase-1
MKKHLLIPILVVYKEKGSKGTGRFGPFIKWDGLFINVSKSTILIIYHNKTLIEDKIQKNIDKVLHNWKTKAF